MSYICILVSTCCGYSPLKNCYPDPYESFLTSESDLQVGVPTGIPMAQLALTHELPGLVVSLILHLSMFHTGFTSLFFQVSGVFHAHFTCTNFPNLAHAINQTYVPMSFDASTSGHDWENTLHGPLKALTTQRYPSKSSDFGYWAL